MDQATRILIEVVAVFSFNLVALIIVRWVTAVSIARTLTQDVRMRTIEINALEIKPVLFFAMLYSALLGPRSLETVTRLREHYKRYPGEIRITLVTGAWPTYGEVHEQLQELGRRIAFAAANGLIQSFS